MRNKLALIGSICIVMILAALPFMTACPAEDTTTPPPPPTDTTTPPPPPPPDEDAVVIDEWNLPLLVTLTGPLAPYGLMGDWSANYVAEQINAAGGIRGVPVKITSYDTAMDPTKSVISMTEALATEPYYIIGPMDTVSMGSAAHLAVKEGVAMTGEFAGREKQLEFAPWGVYERTNMTDTAAAGFKEWIRLNPDIESVVVVMIPGLTDEPVSGIVQGCAELGIPILETLEVETGMLDLSAVATRALSLEPDGFCCELHGDTGARFCKALFERGMTEGRRIMIGGQAGGEDLYVTGEGYIEDCYYWECAYLTSEDPGWLAYIDAYGADNGGLFPYTWANWGPYDAVFAFKTAVERLKITGDPAKRAEERLAIRDFFWNAQDLPSVFGGTFSYSEGAKQMDPCLFQIKDNQLVLISRMTPGG